MDNKHHVVSARRRNNTILHIRSNHIECVQLNHFFFFQAEDGIRDYKVTGVQTCALPIYTYVTELVPSYARGRYVAITQVAGFMAVPVTAILARLLVPTHFLMMGWRWVMVKIGKAACRGRG